VLRTAVVIDERYEDHETGSGHPERAERIAVLRDLVESLAGSGLIRLEPRPATPEKIALVHSKEYLKLVARTAGSGPAAFDADTPVSSRSYETALLATGGLLALVDTIMADGADNGFALVRPPGHHAEADRAMGFCLFNNVAIAARWLCERHGLDRVVIVDWDVHHGNGTQHSFADDRRVLYVSTHQYPFYPGTGRAEEVGVGEAKGLTVNVPLPAGCGDGEFLDAFLRVIDPVCRQFEPQFVLVSAGFDAHHRDPLAGMRVTDEGFACLARVLLRVAAEWAGGRFAAVLEGGYDLDALRGSVARVLEEMRGEHLAELLPATPVDCPAVPRVIEAHRQYWDLESSQLRFGK
jgi:acetoin utilization deacetylase AcuC-like enzyme